MELPIPELHCIMWQHNLANVNVFRDIMVKIARINVLLVLPVMDMDILGIMPKHKVVNVVHVIQDIMVKIASFNTLVQMPIRVITTEQPILIQKHNLVHVLVILRIMGKIANSLIGTHSVTVMDIRFFQEAKLSGVLVTTDMLVQDVRQLVLLPVSMG